MLRPMAGELAGEPAGDGAGSGRAAAPTRERLLAAWRAGQVVDARRGGRRTRLDPALIRQQCRDHVSGTDPHGIRIRGAVLAEPLDLVSMPVPFPLEFVDCVFEHPVNVEGADLHALSLVDCELPGLLGNGVRIRRDLDLSRSRIRGGHLTTASTSARAAVWLCEASIGGRLLCVDTRVEATGERAIQADRVQVGGVVRLIHRFHATGEIRMVGAQLGGSLDLTAATIENPHGFALGLGAVSIGGSLFITNDVDGRRPLILGRVDLNSGRIAGQVVARHLTLHGPPGELVARGYSTTGTSDVALYAPRLSVGTAVTLEGECRIHGGVELSGSDLGGLQVAGTCRFSNPGRTALDLTNAEVRSSLQLQPGTRIEGRLRFSRARIRGRADLAGLKIEQPEDGVLVDGYGAVVDGTIELQDARATGGALVLNSARASFVSLERAVVEHPGGQTVNLRQATVSGAVLLSDGFVSRGCVVLDSADILGRLDLGDGSFTDPAGPALTARSAHVRGGVRARWAECAPSVDLSNLVTTVLDDDPLHWPAGIAVSGMTYDRFHADDGRGAGWDPVARCAWLARQVSFDAGPYEQAARVLRAHGHLADAELILIRQRDEARRVAFQRSPPAGQRLARLRAAGRYAQDWLYGRTVGYGYRPGRALYTLLGLLAFMVLALLVPAVVAPLRAVDVRGNVYATDGRLVTVQADQLPTGPQEEQVSAASRSRTGADRCGGGQVRCFDPLLYGIDTVIPLVDLDQRKTWYADPYAPHGRLVEYLLSAGTLAGWLLSTVGALTFARLARPVG